MLDPEAEYLYRGTSLGWAGTRMNQFIPRTSTSSDPLVATLFALECIFHGHSVVQLALRSDLESYVRPPNRAFGIECFSEIECEVALELRPLDFASRVVHFIDADDAREILLAIGYDQVPYQIGSLDELTEHLQETHELGFHLTAARRAEFNRRAFGVEA